MHYQRAALRLERTALIVADISRKYDPDQPRIAAGSPSGGQWGLGGYARDAVGHLREASNRVAAIAQSLAAYPSEQALNIYNALAAANNAQQQAIIIFAHPDLPLLFRETLVLLCMSAKFRRRRHVCFARACQRCRTG